MPSVYPCGTRASFRNSLPWFSVSHRDLRHFIGSGVIFWRIISLNKNTKVIFFHLWVCQSFSLLCLHTPDLLPSPSASWSRSKLLPDYRARDSPYLCQSFKYPKGAQYFFKGNTKFFGLSFLLNTKLFGLSAPTFMRQHFRVKIKFDIFKWIVSFLKEFVKNNLKNSQFLLLAELALIFTCVSSLPTSVFCWFVVF